MIQYNIRKILQIIYDTSNVPKLISFEEKERNALDTLILNIMLSVEEKGAYDKDNYL